MSDTTQERIINICLCGLGVIVTALLSGAAVNLWLNVFHRWAC